jgi:hypothetical protein
MRWTAAREPGVLTRQAEVARALKIAPPDASDSAASNGLIERLQNLILQLGLPNQLSRCPHQPRATAGRREPFRVARSIPHNGPGRYRKPSDFSVGRCFVKAARKLNMEKDVDGTL